MAQAVGAGKLARARRPQARPAPGHHAGTGAAPRLAQARLALLGRRPHEARLLFDTFGEGALARLARRGAAQAQAPEAEDEAMPERGEEGVEALRADVGGT